MLRKLCSWLLYKRLGWKTEVNEDYPKKCIICLAPHTSNWDFILSQLFIFSKGLRINYLMKKEWFFWPLGVLFRHTGGIPVNRHKNTSLTSSLADAAIKADTFLLAITPEGTRSLNPHWKKGFYVIAQRANIPILLYSIDYEKRLIKCIESVWPTEPVEEGIEHIKQQYKGVIGRHPDQFAI